MLKPGTRLQNTATYMVSQRQVQDLLDRAFIDEVSSRMTLIQEGEDDEVIKVLVEIEVEVFSDLDSSPTRTPGPLRLQMRV